MSRRTVAGPHSVRENMLEDIDADTKVTVEANSDEDKIRFSTAGIERVIINDDGQVGIGTSSPGEILTLNAANPTIRFEEGDTLKATIGVNSADNILIENKTMNKHIVFKANDQGTVREGLRLDGAVPEVVVNQQHGINGDNSLIDFRVESENSTHMFFVDGSVDRIGIKHSTPASTLTIAGSLALKVHSINAANDPGTTYSILTTDCVLLVNTRPQAQGGIDSTITLTLPDASDNPGMVLTIKDAAGYCDVNAITINASSGDNIDGIPSTTSINLPSPGSWKKMISDGTSSWYEIG